MRIAVLTYHWAYNFGANLQALATQSYLNSLGHQVTVLDYRPAGMVESLYSQVIDSQVETHKTFCNTYLNQSPRCESEADLITFCREANFDAVLVGSDAVFRLARKPKREDQRFPNPFWLEWTRQLSSKPIVAALAASCMGTPFFLLPASTQKGISRAVRNFNRITVRDQWTQWMIWWFNQGRRKPLICPDPVNVLNEVYSLPDELTEVPRKISKQYILLSFFKGMVSDLWLQDFIEIAHKQNLYVYSLPLPEQVVDVAVDKVIGLPLSPLEWFAWIQNAAGYVGVRFHAAVSAITNRVPFIAFDNYEWRSIRLTSKTYDLCKQTGVPELCFNKRLRERLHPQQAFDLLFSDKQKTVNQYALKASKRVKEILPQLLTG